MSERETLVREFVLKNKLGLHARPASLFVRTANQYESDITVTKDDVSIDGKSIIGLLTLAAEQDVRIRVTASGADAAEALHALEKLIDDRFGEE